MAEEEQGEVDMDTLIDQLSVENQKITQEKNQAISNLSAFSQANKETNIAQYQISTDELLERLERFFKGEYLGFNDDGEQVWKKPKDKDQIPLNSFGVSSLMEIVTKYIDKNTLLSYYSERRIFEIIGDLGEEMVMFILSNYEQMGMNTYFKKTKFRLIIVTTLHMIESTYRRSLGGKTIEEINQSRIIMQSDRVGMNQIQQLPVKQKTSFLNRIFPQ